MTDIRKQFMRQFSLALQGATKDGHWIGDDLLTFTEEKVAEAHAAGKQEGREEAMLEIEALVPQEQTPVSGKALSANFGFNLCRAEILTRIAAARKGEGGVTTKPTT